MYLVTNRGINNDSGSVVDVFGDHPNIKGPKELRIAQISRKNSNWHAEMIDD